MAFHRAFDDLSCNFSYDFRLILYSGVFVEAIVSGGSGKRFGSELFAG